MPDGLKVLHGNQDELCLFLMHSLFGFNLIIYFPGGQVWEKQDPKGSRVSDRYRRLAASQLPSILVPQHIRDKNQLYK